MNSLSIAIMFGAILFVGLVVYIYLSDDAQSEEICDEIEEKNIKVDIDLSDKASEKKNAKHK